MSHEKHKAHAAIVENNVQTAYAAVPPWFKENICDAAEWARDILTRKEGEGHIIEVTASGKNDGLVVCSFSKPSCPADHCGRGMPTGSEAIVMAVCEYLNGA